MLMSSENALFEHGLKHKHLGVHTVRQLVFAYRGGMEPKVR